MFAATRMRREGHPLKSPLKHLSMAVVIALIAIFALPSVASAASLYVDGTLGNDSNACTAPGAMACKTIQAAINKASAGDTINVAAGVYPESAPGPLTINSSLTGLSLLGAQAGVDARNPRAPESSIDDSQGTSVAASSVTLDGFTVENSTNQAFTGYGVWLNPGVSGTQVLNNIFQNNIVGLGLANGGAQALVQHNLFLNNNNTGGATGSGIYSDQFASGATVRNVLVEENTFRGNNNAGIDISNTDFSHGVFNLNVSHNVFDADGRGVLLFNTHDSSIHDNSITGSTLAMSGSIRLFDNNSKISILNNDLIGGAGNGIRLSDGSADPNPPTPSSDVVIHENNIENFPAGDGLLVGSNSHVGTVNAECNWWNSSTGPTNTNNPGGIGEKVEGDADFTPWLTAPAPDGPCVGGLPSTPGKVTGGGQIQGDPVFSSNGSLLSAPAIVPSAADPSAQATFGFVATCCPAKGNLDYIDHPAGVRIKAQSITGLFISTPGSACPATPGSKHAVFTGTAKVITSSGTDTNQPFTVRVDDCGEPGTMDTFAIQTTGYSNGPTILIGGNIQIHK